MDIETYKKLCKYCFNRYYLTDTMNKNISIEDSIINKPLDGNEVLKYANEYLKENLNDGLKMIKKAGIFSVQKAKNGVFYLRNCNVPNSKKIEIVDKYAYQDNLNLKIKEATEKYLEDLENDNLDNYSYDKLRQLKKNSKEYYINNFLKLKNNKYRDIFERKFLQDEFTNGKNNELKEAVLKTIHTDLELCKKLFDNFMTYYPLNQEPKAPNSTIQMILSKKTLEDTNYYFIKLTKEDLIKMLKNYSKYIVDIDLLKQFNRGFEKFSDLKYDVLKYNFDLYEGVKYNSKRLKKMYPRNYESIVNNAQEYMKKYLDEKETIEIKKYNNYLNKEVAINDNYMNIFKKLSEIQTLDLACDYLEEQNIDIKKLESEFNNFKEYIKDKYSTLVINDIEEKVNYYIDVKKKIGKYKLIIENICDDILSDSSKSKHEYFKAYKIKDETDLEKLVNRYYPQTYARYIEKIKLLEKSEVDKILNKINELGNNFTIFDYANITDLNIVKFLEKLYEYYPKNKENDLIMEMDFAKALTSMDINIDEYLQNDFYVVLGNDLYQINNDDKKEVIDFLNDYNLPINNQTCKEAAKKIIETKKKSVKSH